MSLIPKHQFSENVKQTYSKLVIYAERYTDALIIRQFLYILMLIAINHCLNTFSKHQVAFLVFVFPSTNMLPTNGRSIFGSFIFV